MPQVSDSDTNQQQQADGLDEFDAVMNELTASPGEAPADTAAADDEGDLVDGSDTADTQPGSATAEAGTQDQAAGTPPPAQAQSSDIWASAPAELREAFERERAEWTHRLSSTQGRLSAADRELARLRREAGAKPDGQGHSQGGEAQQQGNNPFESDRIKALKEEYGEVAGPILELLEAQHRELAALKAPVAEVAQQREIEARHSEISTFTAAHPDWEQYVNDQRYPEWLSTQPKAVQDAAQRAVNVEDGREAAWLLSQFKAHIGVTSSAPPSGTGTGQTSATPQPSVDPKRQRQLAAGRDAGSSAPPVQSGIPDDFDAAMDHIIATRERARNATGQFR